MSLPQDADIFVNKVNQEMKTDNALINTMKKKSQGCVPKSACETASQKDRPFWEDSI